MNDKSKKISSYLGAAAAVLGANSAQAQLLYTDIDDTTVVDGIFELDLDGDTIVDFTIEHVLKWWPIRQCNFHPSAPWRQY